MHDLRSKQQRPREPWSVQPFLMALLICLCWTPAQAAQSIRIGWIGDTQGDAFDGARQGVIEANAQGKFLNMSFELVPLAGAPDDDYGDMAVIVAALNPVRLLRVVEQAGDMAVINIAADDDELREACLPNLLHTIPSAAMLDDAIRQWRTKRPGGNVSAQAWHPGFKKYAAAQLNKRYEESAGRAMSDVAWAAWAAVKLVADTNARHGHLSSSALLKVLRRDLAFDGQKGIDMSFRNTGQLRQPILLIEDDNIVGEAPVRGVVASTALDSLGLGDCHK